MREYKSKVIKMYVDSDYEEFDNVETDFAENDEVVDLQDLPYAAKRCIVLHLAESDSAEDIKIMRHLYRFQSFIILNIKRKR